MQFPTFEICEECNAIYTHQSESVDSETGKFTPAENSIHYIADVAEVPYQEPIEVSHTFDSEKIHTCEKPIFAKDGKYKRRFVGNQNGIVHAPRQVVEVSTKRQMIPKNKVNGKMLFDDNGKLISKSDKMLAIVGSSKIMDWQHQEMESIIRNTIKNGIKAWGDRLVLGSGGAKGVDTLAEQIAIELGVRTRIYKPDVQGWEDGEWDSGLQRIKIGYKTRDTNIANRCCKILNLVGKAPKKPKIARVCKKCNCVNYDKYDYATRKTEVCKECKACKSKELSSGRSVKVMCKHCNLPHYSSGGCYTANIAFWLGANAETKAV